MENKSAIIPLPRAGRVEEIELIRELIFKLEGVEGKIEDIKSIAEITTLFIHPCGSARAASKKPLDWCTCL